VLKTLFVRNVASRNAFFLLSFLAIRERQGERQAKIQSYTSLQQPPAEHIKKNHKPHLLYVDSWLQNSIWISKWKTLVETCQRVQHEHCSEQLTGVRQSQTPPPNAPRKCYPNSTCWLLGF